jgi:hypothetical protein
MLEKFYLVKTKLTFNFENRDGTINTKMSKAT